MLIGKKYVFHAAHYIPDHEHCGKIHGHTYTLDVGIAGITCADGMVMDFYILDEIVKPLVDEWDHNGLLNDHIAFEVNPPTAENMLETIWEEIVEALAEEEYEGLQLARIKLWETDKCYVERTNPDVDLYAN